MMGDIIRTAAQRKATLYADGAYDFVDVRDVANGLITAAEKGKTGESCILSGHQISVAALLEAVRQVTGRGFPKLKISFPLAAFAARFTPLYYRLSKASPRFTPYSLEVLQSNSAIGHAKATHELGYSPRPVYESIADSIRWFFEHHRGRKLQVFNCKRSARYAPTRTSRKRKILNHEGTTHRPGLCPEDEAPAEQPKITCACGTPSCVRCRAGAGKTFTTKSPSFEENPKNPSRPACPRVGIAVKGLN